MGLDRGITVGVARRLPPLTLEITLQFQMYVLGIDKHIEILSLDFVFGYIFELIQYHTTVISR